MGEHENFWTWSVWAPILVTLASGTVSSLANKVAYQTPIEGSCGTHFFEKAYFFTLAMFIGEFLCLIGYFVKQFFLRRAEKREGGSRYRALGDDSPNLIPLNDPGLAAGKKPPVWVYAVLCCFDLSATSVGGVGLIWVDASTNQMLRGSMVVFCAIFSVIMLKRRLSLPQWGSIGLVCLGLILVGLAGMLAPHKATGVSAGQMLIGIFLVLLASALNAVQNVFEEKLLKAVGGAEVDPLELVGWEGFFGSLLSGLALLPIVSVIPGSDCGKAEDTISTFIQLGHSPLTIGMVVSFIVGLALMNFTSQQISQKLSAVHRNLVSAVRTVLVWIGSLILYYATEHDDVVYGEKWTTWSLLELAGFAALVGGTVLYSYFGLKLSKQAAMEEEARQISPDFGVVLPIEPATH